MYIYYLQNIVSYLASFFLFALSYLVFWKNIYCFHKNILKTKSSFFTCSKIHFGFPGRSLMGVEVSWLWKFFCSSRYHVHVCPQQVTWSAGDNVKHIKGTAGQGQTWALRKHNSSVCLVFFSPLWNCWVIRWVTSSRLRDCDVKYNQSPHDGDFHCWVSFQILHTAGHKRWKWISRLSLITGCKNTEKNHKFKSHDWKKTQSKRAFTQLKAIKHFKHLFSLIGRFSLMSFQRFVCCKQRNFKCFRTDSD